MVHDGSSKLELESADANDLVMLPLAELYAAARALELEAWAGRSADVLDRVFRQRLVRVLGQRDVEQELTELQDHLERVAGRARRRTAGTKTAQAGEHWATRWQGFADLVDTQRTVLASQDPKRVLARTHVPDILARVRSYEARNPEGMLQAQLREDLGLKKANLTRILNLMEANELIERRGLGRENRIRVGRAARELAVTPAAKPVALDSQNVRRGLDYFRKPTSFSPLSP